MFGSRGLRRMSGEPPTKLLVAAAIGSGLVTAIISAPLTPLAALLAPPMVASVATEFAYLLIGWRNTRDGRETLVLDGRTDAMVAALREAAQHAQATPPSFDHPSPSCIASSRARIASWLPIDARRPARRVPHSRSHHAYIWRR
jgi:hypothetical protein